MADLQTKRLPTLPPYDLGRLDSKTDQSGGPDACWPWTGSLNNKGYGIFSIGPGKPRRIFLAHRLAYFLGTGIDPGSMCVCHRCDNPLCQNPAHLWLGTKIQNLHDCMAKGRFTNGNVHWARRHPEWIMRGENNRVSKLTDAKAVEINRLYATGEFTYQSLGEQFGVSMTTVRNVVHGISWKHIVSELSPLRKWHGNTKLTEADVAEIRALWATGNFTQEEIGRKFGTTGSNICNIVNRKVWV
jgi:hypothetical protein